ncbi:class I SAM-dependent methyltransferase [Labrys monachus]|uniref:S-adenosylmethionine-diacylgycerolhomoserine-N-methyltransferase n=1 Tax=Labrys monachus TaxID=217067 RepID=A0ABU0FJ71_9HYPH|nr:methyltransferase domain-containing protein [Labrys monachus]MDQ0394662.1 S-adenosylmethionine-diacylgycerolhomoserine-N-methyltransferase [Labrys monachus]
MSAHHHSPAAEDAAEAMNRNYRYQRHIYDLTRKYYLLGRDRLIASIKPGKDDAILEIGCGTGRNLVAVARRYPQSPLYGFDISTAMLETARRSLARRGLARIALAQADATRFEAGEIGRPGFERIYISYTLSMIPDWRAVLERAVAGLTPGGRLLIVDFGQQERLPAWFKRLLFAWLARYHVHPIAALPAALAELARHHGCRLDCRSIHRGYAVYAELERPR